MFEAHDALMCIGQKTYVNDLNRLKNKAKCKNKNISLSEKVSFFSNFKYNFLFLVNLIKLL